jgi:hypothetical protein
VLPFNLGVVGAPGCTAYCSLDVTVGFFPRPNRATLPIPNVPALVNGVVYFQAYVVDARINALGIATSDLLTVKLGQEL